MPDESLLTDDIRALIGVETPLGSVEVAPRTWRRAVEVYTGNAPEHTPAAGESISGYVIAGLDTDYESVGMPNVMPNSILISNQWEFDRPLRMGETLQAAHRLVDITERFGGRFGYSLDFRAEVVYRDATGAVVARSGRTMTQYSASDARGGDE